jgi:hypothetical protein
VRSLASLFVVAATIAMSRRRAAASRLEEGPLCRTGNGICNNRYQKTNQVSRAGGLLRESERCGKTIGVPHMLCSTKMSGERDCSTLPAEAIVSCRFLRASRDA